MPTLTHTADPTVALRASTTTTIHDRLLDGLETADTHIANMEATPSAAEQKAAMLFVLRGLKLLARLEIHELTSAD